MSEFKKLKCEFKDKEVIEYIHNVFELTQEQEQKVQEYISNVTKKELKDEPCKLKIEDKQKQEILNFHRSLIDNLKQELGVEDDDELADKLYDLELIEFTEHSLDRIKERFLTPEDNIGFNKLAELYKNPEENLETTSRNAVEVFVKADVVGEKVEFNVSPYCRINYSLEGNKINLSVENRYGDQSGSSFYLVVTVINKNL